MQPPSFQPFAFRCARRVSLLAIPLLFGATGCKPQVAKAPEKKPAEVFVSLPVSEQVTEYEEFTGYLAAERMIEIRARVSGYLLEPEKVVDGVVAKPNKDRAAFVEGAKVKKGDLLLEIDDRVYKANAANAAALLNQAKAKRDGLVSQYKRAQDLVKRDAISKEDAELLQYQLAESEAAVVAAEAKQEMADLDVTYTKVKAPMDGVISNRRVDPGNLVKADDTVLAMMVSQDPIYAYFDVNERTVLRLRRLIQQGHITSAVESKLVVYASLADEEDFHHEGYIDFMDNQLDAATGTLRVRAVMKNTDGLLSPGLFVRLRFPVGGAQKALLVQEESLGADQGERFIYVVGEDNVVKYRRVKVGVLREGKRVIREGLAANEQVILTGLQRVKPGDKVNVKPYVAASTTSSPKSAGGAEKPDAATPPNPMTSKSETGNAEAKPGEAKPPTPPSS